MPGSTIHILAFGSATDVLGWRVREIEWRAGMTVRAVVEALEHECPRLAEARGRLKFAVNESYATLEMTLEAGDALALIPPVAGGESTLPVEARLVREAIDVNELMRALDCPASGAVGVFAGVVRAETDANGVALTALEYSAYEPMALAEMNEIVAEIAERVALNGALLVHRLGCLQIGEASVVAVVSTAHRGESFDACREMIEQLKVRVPIFKKELWAGGLRTWVDPGEGT
jgi:molybdopterin synthase catalytic subunit